MSTPDELPIPPGAVRLAGCWMDGDAEAEATPDAGVESLSERARAQAAEVQLVHALLLHLNEQEPASRQARIDRALQAIRQAPAVVTRRPAWRLPAMLRWALAASLLIAAVSWLHISNSNPALAALDRVLEAINEPIDRTYAIAVEPPDQPAPREPGRAGETNAANDVPSEHGRSGLDGATLYARGGNQFVLARATPSGAPLINGSNGRENWLIRPERPVLISGDPAAFRIPMPETVASVPFVDIRLTLASLRETYQFEQGTVERLSDADPTLWSQLHARKMDAATKGPKTVTLWYHPATNLIGQIRFAQLHLQGRPEPRTITITLVSRQPLPADWFNHESHHPTNQPVEHP